MVVLPTYQKTIKEIRALRGEDVFIEVLTPDSEEKKVRLIS